MGTESRKLAQSVKLGIQEICVTLRLILFSVTR